MKGAENLGSPDSIAMTKKATFFYDFFVVVAALFVYKMQVEDHNNVRYKIRCKSEK